MPRSLASFARRGLHAPRNSVCIQQVVVQTKHNNESYYVFNV